MGWCSSSFPLGRNVFVLGVHVMISVSTTLLDISWSAAPQVPSTLRRKRVFGFETDRSFIFVLSESLALGWTLELLPIICLFAALRGGVFLGFTLVHSWPILLLLLLVEGLSSLIPYAYLVKGPMLFALLVVMAFGRRFTCSRRTLWWQRSYYSEI